MGTKKKDFWPDLPQEAKLVIEQAKTELDNRQGIPHEEVMSEIQSRILKDLKEAVDELNLVRAGKLKARNAEDLFDEL